MAECREVVVVVLRKEVAHGALEVVEELRRLARRFDDVAEEGRQPGAERVAPARTELVRHRLRPVLPADLVAVDDRDRDDVLRAGRLQQALRHVRPVRVQPLLRELVAFEARQRRGRAALARRRVADAEDAPEGGGGERGGGEVERAVGAEAGREVDEGGKRDAGRGGVGRRAVGERRGGRVLRIDVLHARQFGEGEGRKRLVAHAHPGRAGDRVEADAEEARVPGRRGEAQRLRRLLRVEELVEEVAARRPRLAVRRGGDVALRIELRLVEREDRRGRRDRPVVFERQLAAGMRRPKRQRERVRPRAEAREVAGEVAGGPHKARRARDGEGEDGDIAVEILNRRRLGQLQRALPLRRIVVRLGRHDHLHRIFRRNPRPARAGPSRAVVEPQLHVVPLRLADRRLPQLEPGGRERLRRHGQMRHRRQEDMRRADLHLAHRLQVGGKPLLRHAVAVPVEPRLQPRRLRRVREPFRERPLRRSAQRRTNDQVRHEVNFHGVIIAHFRFPSPPSRSKQPAPIRPTTREGRAPARPGGPPAD